MRFRYYSRRKRKRKGPHSNRAAQDYMGKLDIIPMDFDEVFYALGLKPKSELTEQVNRQLLRITSSHGWTEILQRYLKN